jgi:D-3-phosphoglycerate dehydrogenase
LTVGIVGTGRIGGLVAGWYAALGARVHAYDPLGVPEGVVEGTLDHVLEQSDLVSLHVPLGNDTRGLISAERLDRMRPGVVIVNVARGGVIDELALADALVSGHVGGAGLDVFAEEPLATDHPLRDAPHTLLTPHVAWKSRRAQAALRAGAVARARLALRGESLPDVVNPEACASSAKED